MLATRGGQEPLVQWFVPVCLVAEQVLAFPSPASYTGQPLRGGTKRRQGKEARPLLLSGCLLEEAELRGFKHLFVQ